jgi:hypothetical protein
LNIRVWNFCSFYGLKKFPAFIGSKKYKARASELSKLHYSPAFYGLASSIRFFRLRALSIALPRLSAVLNSSGVKKSVALDILTSMNLLLFTEITLFHKQFIYAGGAHSTSSDCEEIFGPLSTALTGTGDLIIDRANELK